MDMDSPEMSKLFEVSKLAKEEFEIIICSFAFWEKLYKDKSQENHASRIIRTLFFRETILGITRIWDDSKRNKLSLSIFRIKRYLEDKRIVGALANNRSIGMEAILDSINVKGLADLASRKSCILKNCGEDNASIAEKICARVSKYENEEKQNMETLKTIRDKLIAHREIKFEPETNNTINIVRSIYADTSFVIESLVDVLGCERWEINKVESLYRKMADNL